ncbi:MAG TPA: permease-like cell division protein FtsX, partial [Longimicrobiales bacterium]|nr:permease-like cell division protein FtsX [Longimicrobiales bacterium]
AMMIALSLFVVGLFGLVAYNVREVVQAVESRVEVVAFLRDDAAPGSVDIAIAQIREYPEVSEVRYVSREQALEKARREFAELTEIFGSIEGNPLPASLEIALRPGQAGLETVRSVARKVDLYPFVEDVRYGDDWVDTVFLLRRVAAAATFALGGGFALVAALIIGAAIRMAVYARRDEIIIMRLVGATDAFIRRPFVLEGLMTGFIGAVLALLATWGVYRSLAGSQFAVAWLPPSWLAVGLGTGALVGILASTFAVRRHLREIA